jgi:CheY-like chemotaxis protein
MSEALLEGVFGTLNELQLNAAQTIDRSGEYLLALIDNMADLSQIQAGKLELDLTSVTITELCQSSISFVEHNATQKQIQLDLNIPIDLSSIYIDFQRMRQVLINLLSHAIDSTPVGGKVELVVTQVGDTIGADNIATEIASIQFAVIDTSKEISLIDSSNYVAHFSSNQDRHVGLGLMLVQPIVALHGGNLSCQSIGKGNCFQISLPHNLDNFDITMDSSSYYTNDTDERFSKGEAMPTDIIEEISETPKNPGLSPLILIVEDNPLNVNTIESYLTAKGYRSIVANDGQAAIELAEQQHPDLILMDIQMPGMDGLEATIEIRQNPQLVTTPIIALTALAMDGDREKCLRAGANDYLTKPFKLKQLHNVIQQFLAPRIDSSDVDVESDLWS